MPSDVFLKVEAVGGEKSSAPSVSEIGVTKSLDCTSPVLFGEEEAGNFFAYGGDSQTAGAHTGGMNVCFGDGSVRNVHDSITVDYNPYVTVDYIL